MNKKERKKIKNLSSEIFSSLENLKALTYGLNEMCKDNYPANFIFSILSKNANLLSKNFSKIYNETKNTPHSFE